MDRARAAEWMLRGVVGRERAAALVGDEMETRPGAGGVRFWGSMTLLMVALSWRNVVSLVAAPVIAIMVCGMIWFKLETPHELLLLQTGPSETSRGTLTLLASLSGMNLLLWGQSAFALVRFGVRDGLFKTSLLFAVLVTAVMSVVWLPHGVLVSAIAMTMVVLFLLSAKRRRAALGVCLAVMGVDWLAGAVLHRAFWQEPVMLWPLLPFLFLVPVLGGMTAMWLYGRFLEGKDRFPAE